LQAISKQLPVLVGVVFKAEFSYQHINTSRRASAQRSTRTRSTGVVREDGQEGNVNEDGEVINHPIEVDEEQEQGRQTLPSVWDTGKKLETKGQNTLWQCFGCGMDETVDDCHPHQGTHPGWPRLTGGCTAGK